ncbi:MAG: NAD(P) transhydrogenase subunit alpha [Parachlamydiales bacterium]|jgi:NAD(P) transhydrogenase subunit alpha
MKIGCLKEKKEDSRTCIVPKIAAKFKNLGIDIEIEKGIGEGIDIPDEDYIQAGATVRSRKEIFSSNEVILKVNSPSKDDIHQLKPKTLFISFLDPFFEKEKIDQFLKNDINSISMNLILRSTLAQKMDALSSQANLAGYAAVILGISNLKKAMPMMTTPAGTISPAKVFVIGAGVAGLQAIATAKRLGAKIEAFDTRLEAQEQIRSLGGKPLKIDLGETSSTAQGYAKQLSESQVEIQRNAIEKAILSSDIVITTAQVFSKKAPIIITQEMLKKAKKPIVIIDLAITTGGNVEGSTADEIKQVNDVKILAPTYPTNLVAADASFLYSSNLYNLIEYFYDKNLKRLNYDLNNEIIKNCLVTFNSQIISPILNKGI